MTGTLIQTPAELLQPANYVPCSQCGRLLRMPVGSSGFSHCRDHRGWPNVLDFLPDGATYCEKPSAPSSPSDPQPVARR